MRKRNKFLAIAIAAVLVLTVGLATTAFATGSSDDEGAGEQALTANGDELVLAEEGGEEDGPCQGFIDKVLEKLGVTEEELINAISEARSEMIDEWVEQRVNDALANEIIDEDEAAAILEWWQNRPADALDKLGLGKLVGPKFAIFCPRLRLRGTLESPGDLSGVHRWFGVLNGPCPLLPQ